MCSSPKRFNISVPEPTSLHRIPSKPASLLNSSIKSSGNALGYVLKPGFVIKPLISQCPTGLFFPTDFSFAFPIVSYCIFFIFF